VNLLSLPQRQRRRTSSQKKGIGVGIRAGIGEQHLIEELNRFGRGLAPSMSPNHLVPEDSAGALNIFKDIVGREEMVSRGVAVEGEKVYKKEVFSAGKAVDENLGMNLSDMFKGWLLFSL
jgi:hypothetical protein